MKDLFSTISRKPHYFNKQIDKIHEENQEIKKNNKKIEVNQEKIEKKILLVQESIKKILQEIKELKSLKEKDSRVSDILESQKTETQHNKKVKKNRNDKFEKTLIQNEIHPLEIEAIQKVTKFKKQVIKNKIVEQIKQQRYTTNQLKLHIVDDRNYCSKASFYRYIQELKDEKRIHTISINKKEYFVPYNQTERDIDIL